ncbi:hypothetical protein J6590_050624 [Homalodisca vitripennis]|nr:hypothetical protein J6590_050624 [Homalodisca vitripennis]
MKCSVESQCNARKHLEKCLKAVVAKEEVVTALGLPTKKIRVQHQNTWQSSNMQRQNISRLDTWPACESSTCRTLQHPGSTDKNASHSGYFQPLGLFIIKDPSIFILSEI